MNNKNVKIVLTRSLLPTDKKYIEDGLKKIVQESFELLEPNTYDENGILEIIDDADVLLGPYVTKKIIQKAEHLKLIQVPWTGMDTFNFEAMKDSNIPVCNTHSNADAVAELAVAIVLDLLKKVSYHDRKMRVGNWNRNQNPLNLKSRMMSKQTICILGCGKIGYKIAKILKGFGSNVVAVDSNCVDHDNILSRIYLNEEIVEALKNADIMICTLPLTNTTKDLINSSVLEKIKPGQIIVNMSRAEIMEENAIYTALQSGYVSGFGADVWWNSPKRGESESYPSVQNEFWKMENVVMSPHRAGFVEGCLPHLDEAITNLANLIQGNPLINMVDIDKHY